VPLADFRLGTGEPGIASDLEVDLETSLYLGIRKSPQIERIGRPVQLYSYIQRWRAGWRVVLGGGFGDVAIPGNTDIGLTPFSDFEELETLLYLGIRKPPQIELESAAPAADFRPGSGEPGGESDFEGLETLLCLGIGRSPQIELEGMQRRVNPNHGIYIAIF